MAEEFQEYWQICTIGGRVFDLHPDTFEVYRYDFMRRSSEPLEITDIYGCELIVFPYRTDSIRKWTAASTKVWREQQSAIEDLDEEGQ